MLSAQDIDKQIGLWGVYNKRLAAGNTKFEYEWDGSNMVGNWMKCTLKKDYEKNSKCSCIRYHIDFELSPLHMRSVDLIGYLTKSNRTQFICEAIPLLMLFLVF